MAQGHVDMLDKMNDSQIVDCGRTSGFERMVLMMKVNPLIPVGMIVTGALLIRMKYASRKEFGYLIYLRPLSQAITFSMIIYTAYTTPEIFNKSSFPWI
ncbi:hypothetical protein MS3_00005703 [Schistosoma haematobium]|uniref:Uncharacterized protein n=1 Tax=Schistosoma haematobium TaxID=6185 RepID=A0A922LL82_SCHHA|nr:hypothetical protein MS3_00005703 [Schistosoma haematobium]KAH9588255.1 hypothetical protein MS3_00005703 [Schistosoma haematobium]